MSYVNFNDNFKASEKIAMLAARIEEFSSEELDGSRIVIRGKQHFAGSHFGLTRRTINAYDAIAEKFADTWFDHPPLEALELLNEQLPRSSTILDVGCGPGHHAQFFRRNGHEVAGIDLSREMLRVATARTRGIVYKQMDMRSLDFPRHSFDGLWCAGSAIHVPKEGLNSQLIEFKKILKPSGLLGLNLQIGRQSEIAADGRFFEFYESREEITSILTNVGFDIVNENYGETARNTHELELTLKWLTLYCRPAQSGHAGRADNNS
jgi:SAM-dependent methyltransferase